MSPSTTLRTGYDGGKGGAGVYQWIINQIPPHRHYIDLFLGNSAVARHKRPAECCSIGVEINEAVIREYWRDHDVPGLIVRQGDAISFLDEPGLPDELDRETFIYCDPPYLMETRSCQRQLYEYELAEREEHIELLRKLKALPCMVAISGYWSELYAEELATWRTSSFWTVNRAGARVQEWLWMNYPPPLELHDYRYLGRDFRERERIKRKKARWTERLRKMPDLERYALMEVIGELRSPASSISSDAAREARIDGNDDEISSEEGERSTIARNDDAIRIPSLDLAIGAPIAGGDDAS